LSLAGEGASPDDLIAIEVGRVITVSGEDLEGGIILIEAGRIKAIGKGLEIPWNARVLKYPQGVAMPGLIACHSSVGLRFPQENVPNAPYISVVDGIDPSSATIKNSLRDGITVAHVMPSNSTRIGGQGAVLRLTGRTVEEMVIASPSGMKISLSPPRGETRMESMAALRKTFLDLHSRVVELALDAAPPVALAGRPAERPELAAVVESRPDWGGIAWDSVPMDKVGPELSPLVDLVRGKMPAFLHCATASDVFKAFEIIDAHGLKSTLILGADAFKLDAVLQSRKDLGPVILNSEQVIWDTDPATGKETRHVTPRILFDAGIRFALQPAEGVKSSGPGFSRDGEHHLWYQAALLVRFGIPRDEALKTITQTPAQILGLDHRMGTLEVGKDANITIFSGDPLDARSWVEEVLIEGKEAYRRDKDRELELLLKDPEKSF
jgi:imidazolonepropionase-like amidohydrolase